MKKFLFLILLLLLSITPVFAEQYLLQCKMNIEAINTATGQVLTRSPLDRYFIIDTILFNVYDANNLPLDVEGFDDNEIVFRHKAADFKTIVETRVVYNRITKQIKLNEIYANNAYSNRAQFCTRGEGTCSEIEIHRKPIFY